LSALIRVQQPDCDPDGGPDGSLPIVISFAQRIAPKYVRNFRVILLTDVHLQSARAHITRVTNTNKQTNKPTRLQNLLGGGNKRYNREGERERERERESSIKPQKTVTLI